MDSKDVDDDINDRASCFIGPNEIVPIYHNNEESQ